MSSPHQVLLVDTDVEALGELASSLRSRGLAVANASDAFEAVEQAFKIRPDVVLVERRLDDEQDVVRAFGAVPELLDIPVLYLVSTERIGTLGPNQVVRSDIDRLVSRITSESQRGSDMPLDRELRGTLEQMPIVDLLQLLAMNRRSGVLSVATTNGAGEIRVSQGDVLEAVYGRLEGEKAFYRLLTVEEGRFTFSPGERAGAPSRPLSSRRLSAPTSHLLMEAMRQADEVRRLRDSLELSGHALGRVDGEASGGAMSLAQERVLQLVAMPRSLEDLLDEHSATDLDVLTSIQALEKSGTLQRVPLAELMTAFATPEQAPVLRSLVARLTRAGFAPPLRVLIAGATSGVEGLRRAVRRIAEVSQATDTTFSGAGARSLGTLRLGEGVELALVWIPTDPDFSPSWALMLPGAAAVVRLGGAGGVALKAHCDAAEVPVVEGELAVNAFDVRGPAQIAGLVRAALEIAVGV